MINLTNYALNVKVDSPAFKREVYEKRLDLIDIALGWPGSATEGTMIFNNIWEYAQDSSYKVSLGKYGKEFYESGQTGNNQKNCNDMRPSVLKDGVVIDSVRGGFDDIFRLMESCLSKPNSKDLLVAFATLFYRNALLIDHRIDNIDNKHYYIYEPPRQLLDLICSSISYYEGIPMEVYIHFLDAIGFNEDVKYFTQGKLQKKTGIGRENNMKTYTHDACCLLGHTSWADFIYNLIRSYGVSPISNQEMASFFPELGIECNERRRRVRSAASTPISITQIIDQYL